MSDLSSFDTIKGSIDGAECFLHIPGKVGELIFNEIQKEEGEPEKEFWTLNIFGPESRQSKDVRARMQRMNEKAAKDSKKKSPKSVNEITEETDPKEVAEIVVDLIGGWNGIKEHGQYVEFSRKNAIDILTRYPWISLQIVIFNLNVSNFIKG